MGGCLLDVAGRGVGAASHVDAGWCLTVTEVVAVSFAAGVTVWSLLSSEFARDPCVSGGLVFCWIAIETTCWLTGSGGGGVGLTDSLAGGGVGELDVDKEVIEISGEAGGAGLLDALLWPGTGLAEALFSDPSSDSIKRERLR